MPSFDLNKAIALKAESHGVDFLLSMIKLRGFGGKTEFWEYNLESFTLMAGLAAVTEKIKIYATCPTLVIPPAFAARMCNTVDSISHGRFGINLITGWQRPEYSQMGLWPGDEHFRNRYQMLGEYAHILRELWESGVSDFKGEYYQMDDCRVRPLPQGEMKIICAGSSDEGLAFSARWADYAFCLGKGVNTPKAFAANNDRLMAATAKTNRDVKIYALFMVIADETDEAAMEKWISYREGVDEAAVAWLGVQGAADMTSDTTNVRQLADRESAVNLNMGTLVGSYEKVAAMLDEVAAVPNTGGVLLVFDDFIKGTEDYGTRIQPLMKCRASLPAA
jgi:pyrimidine oxygenase